MERTITVGGVPMRMRASALIPRLYRAQFGRDLISDMRKVSNSLRDIIQAQKSGKQAEFDMLDLTIFENVAWLMLKNGGNNVGNTPEEWLDSMEDNMFSVYEYLPEVLALWADTNKVTSESAKK